MFDGRRNVAEVFAAYDKLNPGKFSLPKLEQLVQVFFFRKACSSIKPLRLFYRKSVRTVHLTCTQKYV